MIPHVFPGLVHIHANATVPSKLQNLSFLPTGLCPFPFPTDWDFLKTICFGFWLVGFLLFVFLFCFVVLEPTRAKQASAALYIPSPLRTFCFDAGSQEVGQPGMNSLRMP